MGIDSREKGINKIYADKFFNYLGTMKIAGCSTEDIIKKYICAQEFKTLTVEEKAKIVVDDNSILKHLTKGVVLGEGEDTLYEGINEELTNAIVCDMASIYPNTKLSKKQQDEIDSDQVQLIEIKDRVSYDIKENMPDVNKMYFNGQGEEFNNRMNKLFDSPEKVQLFSKIVDESVTGIDKSTGREITNEKKQQNEKLYKELMNEVRQNKIDYNFDVKMKL